MISVDIKKAYKCALGLLGRKYQELEKQKKMVMKKLNGDLFKWMSGINVVAM
jgi:hypothetical protein